MERPANGVNRPEDIGIGSARAIHAAVSGRPGGVYLDLTAAALSATLHAEAGRKALLKVVDSAPRQIPATEAITHGIHLLGDTERALIVLGKGAAYAQADQNIRAVRRQHRHPVFADVHGEGPIALQGPSCRMG